MQMRSQGTVVPDAFTHGSSKQRVHWFRVGWDDQKRMGDRLDTISTE